MWFWKTKAGQVFVCTAVLNHRPHILISAISRKGPMMINVDDRKT